jgi:hypothetical protein
MVQATAGAVVGVVAGVAAGVVVGAGCGIDRRRRIDCNNVTCAS